MQERKARERIKQKSGKDHVEYALVLFVRERAR